MDKQIEELERIFEKANDSFLEKNGMLFETQVSERTLCGALMIELHEVIKDTKYYKYFVDVEYNRNVGGTLKTVKKTVQGTDEKIVTINCDLIVHSRGQNAFQDNLIALEMKKSTGKKKDKESDRDRLECLTKCPDQGVWSCGGKAFPENVCGYGLGVYYEINFKKRNILVEYYQEGYCYHHYIIELNNYLEG